MIARAVPMDAKPLARLLEAVRSSMRIRRKQERCPAILEVRFCFCRVLSYPQLDVWPLHARRALVDGGLVLVRLQPRTD
jgi:hypothetical protein